MAGSRAWGLFAATYLQIVLAVPVPWSTLKHCPEATWQSLESREFVGFFSPWRQILWLYQDFGLRIYYLLLTWILLNPAAFAACQFFFCKSRLTFLRAPPLKSLFPWVSWVLLGFVCENQPWPWQFLSRKHRMPSSLLISLQRIFLWSTSLYTDVQRAPNFHVMWDSLGAESHITRNLHIWISDKQ